MGPPRQFALNKTFPARPNTAFYHLSPKPFPLGSADSRVIFILHPRASSPSSAGPNQSHLRCRPEATWVFRLPCVVFIRMCPETEICAAPIRICRHNRAALLDLFYCCRNVL